VSRPTLSPEGFARELGVHRKTVLRWCESGRVQFAQPAGKGGKHLIPASEVDRIWDEIKGKE
jgi:excisionase family DNA binding protein